MNVTFDRNCPYNPIYTEFLTKGIAAITHRIEVDASSIQWIVYDSNHAPDLTAYGKPKSTLQQLNEKFMLSLPQIRRQYGVSEYGFCYICNKTIYISLKTILSCRNLLPVPSLPPQVNFMLNRRAGPSLFTSVILDELTHIVTGKGHDSPEYKATLASYYQKCMDL